jgi:hypothetical protein
MFGATFLPHERQPTYDQRLLSPVANAGSLDASDMASLAGLRRDVAGI